MKASQVYRQEELEILANKKRKQRAAVSARQTVMSTQPDIPAVQVKQEVVQPKWATVKAEEEAVSSSSEEEDSCNVFGGSDQDGDNDSSEDGEHIEDDDSDEPNNVQEHDQKYNQDEGSINNDELECNGFSLGNDKRILGFGQMM